MKENINQNTEEQTQVKKKFSHKDLMTEDKGKFLINMNFNIVISKGKLFKLAKLMKELRKAFKIKIVTLEKELVNLTGDEYEAGVKSLKLFKDTRLKLEHRFKLLETMLREEGIDKLIDVYTKRLVKETLGKMSMLDFDDDAMEDD